MLEVIKKMVNLNKQKIKKLLEAEIRRKAKKSFCIQYPNVCWGKIENPTRF